MAKKDVGEGGKFRLTTGTAGRDEELMRGNVNVAEEQTKPDKNGVYDLSAEQVAAIKLNPGFHLRAADYEPPSNAKKEPAPVKTSVLDKSASEEVKNLRDGMRDMAETVKELAERLDAVDATLKGVAELVGQVEDLDKRISKLEK